MSETSGESVASGRQSILLLVASNRRRGAEVFGERLAQGLEAMGWAVDFVALHPVDSPKTVSATPLTSSGAGRRLDMATVWALRQRIAAGQPSLILANGGATLRYAVAARSLVRKRPLLAYASIGEPDYWLRSGRHAQIQRYLHRRADLVLAVSEMTRRQLIGGLGVAAEKVHVAHTGVPPEFFVPPGTQDRTLRLLFLGSLSNEKDPLTAVDVATRLRESHSVALRIVGDGPLAPALSDKIARERLAAFVDLNGPADDVIPHLAWADLLLLTSRTEGLPGAVIEAGAAGVPAVAFAVGGTDETMLPGRGGVLIPPGNIDDMAAAIARLAEDETELAAMGQVATQFVAEHFTLEHAIARFDTLLSDAIREQS
mgnify:CR=1 FL=1